MLAVLKGSQEERRPFLGSPTRSHPPCGVSGLVWELGAPPLPGSQGSSCLCDMEGFGISSLFKGVARRGEISFVLEGVGVIRNVGLVGKVSFWFLVLGRVSP